MRITPIGVIYVSKLALTPPAPFIMLCNSTGQGNLAAMLTGMGHDALLAADGREALGHQLKHPADIMLTDIFMPGMEGLETIQRIRERYPNLQIIAMTARVPDERMGDLLEIAQRFGARETLRKPFTLRQLADALAKLIPT